MFSFESFPAVRKTPSKYYIIGEVYRIDNKTLNRLDELEGNGYFYKRESVALQGFDNRVWIYFHIENEVSDSMEHIEIRGNVATWT